MSPRLGGWAIVGLAALDLRRRPDHRSELRSQLLLGEVLRCPSTPAKWLPVRNCQDGYQGWVRAWGLVPVTAAGARAWTRSAQARVTVPYAEVREHPGGGAVVSPAFWQAALIPLGRRRGFREVRLPDGRQGWVDGRALGGGAAGHAVERRALARRVKGLLGTPYLWGGRTPLGLDCSAFTQLVLMEHGVRLPRDADQQYRVSRPIKPGMELELGDLVFFGPTSRPLAHVGLALGGGYYVHARGSVRVGSLDPLNPLYDLALHRQFRGVRRPPQGRVGRGGRSGFSV
jgi:cell wall-associated NlpC family hydrolase